MEALNENVFEKSKRKEGYLLKRLLLIDLNLSPQKSTTTLKIQGLAFDAQHSYDKIPSVSVVVDSICITGLTDNTHLRGYTHSVFLQDLCFNILHKVVYCIFYLPQRERCMPRLTAIRLGSALSHSPCDRLIIGGGRQNEKEGA